LPDIKSPAEYAFQSLASQIQQFEAATRSPFWQLRQRPPGRLSSVVKEKAMSFQQADNFVQAQFGGWRWYFSALIVIYPAFLLGQWLANQF
jgi:hypothetical protein